MPTECILCGHPTTYDSGHSQECSTDVTCDNYKAYTGAHHYPLEPGSVVSAEEITKYGYIWKTNAQGHSNKDWRTDNTHDFYVLLGGVEGPPNGGTDTSIGIYIPSSISYKDFERTRKEWKETTQKKDAYGYPI